jgi:hypothetical protein
VAAALPSACFASLFPPQPLVPSLLLIVHVPLPLCPPAAAGQVAAVRCWRVVRAASITLEVTDMQVRKENEGRQQQHQQ